MSELDHNRESYIDSITLDRKRHKLEMVWEDRVVHARQVFIKKHTVAARRELDHAYFKRRQRRRLHESSHDAMKHKRAVYIEAKANVSRDEALAWATKQVGTREATGNNDGPTILGWQRATARGSRYLDRAPYCGIGCENACRRAGVKTSPRWASVAYIEDDARAKRNGFRGYTTDHTRVQPGDLVILYGRGVHVEIVRYVKNGIVYTIGFNTSPGNSGSQSNGGGTYLRERPLSVVHGFPLVDYPN